MVRSIVMTVALGLAFAGCAAKSASNLPAPTAGTVETIRYETGPCFGACPVYVVTVSSDGRGEFEGRQHTAVKGTRPFAVTHDEYSDFRGRLEPFRPQGDRRVTDPNCGGAIATDLPSVDITWSAKGPSSRLYVYYGCDMERNAAMFQALQQAPEALPIEGFVRGS